MKSNNSKHWSIGCKIIQWRINTQYHHTLKNTPYRLVYRMNPHCGISNLPFLEDILNTLVTEAGLNDVLPHLDKDCAKDCAAAKSVGSESLVASPPMTHVDKDVAAVLDLVTPIGNVDKRKQHEVSMASRDIHRARHTAFAQVMVGSSHDSPPREGTKTDDIPIYIRWLELIDQQDDPVEHDKMLHSRVNSVFPIIYCVNSKDLSNDSNWAPCILRKIQKEQYEVLDIHERDKADKDLDWGGDEGLSALWTM